MSFPYELNVTNIQGAPVQLADYRGKVLLVVNVASECGFTPQYKGLQALHDKYASRGLTILGFPCDQFGHQEPGDEAAISDFCERNFGVTFPLFAKIDVNGSQTTPLFATLKKAAPGLLGTEAIKWNFTKFLVSRDGTKITRFASRTTPEELEKDIEAALGG